MITGKEYQDKELGKIVVRVNSRARHIILRARPDAILVTVPLGCTEKELREIIEKYHVKLLSDKKKVERKFIDLDFFIDTEYFKLSLITGNYDKFLAHSELGKMEIICPRTACFDDEDLQKWLRKVIEESLRKNAAIILASRLSDLSIQHNLSYKSFKINSSKGRWGSCSAHKDINLSYYLILLPGYLIDYVLLHELSHTREMNHGERFWVLLDELTGGKAQALRKEIKKYKTDF